MNTYHPSRLSVKAKNKVIETEQAPVKLSDADHKRTQINVAITLIQNGEDFNRPDMKRRGLEIIAKLLFPEVEWDVVDTTLLSNRRDWFLQEVKGWSNG